MKVAFLHGVNADKDSIRGVGVYSRELINSISRFDSLVKITQSTENSDIVHITKFNPFFISIPFLKPASKVVITIHDLIPLIYPKHYPSGIRGKINFLINKFLLHRNIDAIITVSETSKKDICRFLGIHPDRVFVVYHGVKKIYQKLERTKYTNLPKDFALYIGDINYNKNIPNLVKACNLANIPLVIVGKQAKEIEKLDLSHPELSHLKNIDFKNVVRPGFVEDENLVKIINLAKVYVQASFYEGFGLSPLEALACKVPVVASKTQCLVEILGDAAIYFDPKNIEDMADKIKNTKKTGKLPREYTWEKCAQDTINVYKLLVDD